MPPKPTSLPLSLLLAVLLPFAGAVATASVAIAQGQTTTSRVSALEPRVTDLERDTAASSAGNQAEHRQMMDLLQRIDKRLERIEGAGKKGP